MSKSESLNLTCVLSSDPAWPLFRCGRAERRQFLGQVRFETSLTGQQHPGERADALSRVE
jgi:hypothetical protein